MTMLGCIVMQFTMLCACHQLKVLWPVVALVSVDMVDNHSPDGFLTELLHRDKPMLVDPTPVYLQALVLVHLALLYFRPHYMG